MMKWGENYRFLVNILVGEKAMRILRTTLNPMGVIMAESQVCIIYLSDQFL